MRAEILPSALPPPMLRGANGTNGREAGRVRFLPVLILPLILVLTGDIDRVSAQAIAPIQTPYTLIDAESRTRFEVGAEGPLRGNGPLTGYAYVFLTRPHLLDEDVYLCALIAPVYATGELIRAHWATPNSGP